MSVLLLPPLLSSDCDTGRVRGDVASRGSLGCHGRRVGRDYSWSTPDSPDAGGPGCRVTSFCSGVCSRLFRRVRWVQCDDPLAEESRVRSPYPVVWSCSCTVVETRDPTFLYVLDSFHWRVPRESGPVRVDESKVSLEEGILTKPPYFWYNCQGLQQFLDILSQFLTHTDI